MAEAAAPQAGKPQPWFVPGDLDGFFGLAIDNLIQFLLVITLCTAVLEFPMELALGTIIPGAAVSVLLGNVFYAWQAQKLSARTNAPMSPRCLTASTRYRCSPTSSW